MIISYPESVDKAKCYETATVNDNYDTKNADYGRVSYDEKQSCSNVKKGIIVHTELKKGYMKHGFETIMAMDDDQVEFVLGKERTYSWPGGYNKGLSEAEC